MTQRPSECPLCAGCWISKDVWWAVPKANDAQCDWGYLYLCARGHPYFDLSEPPSAAEVASRKHCREHDFDG